jgi:ubiquinone/menaquinone biosynthesis C-methylase UbiE
VSGATLLDCDRNCGEAFESRGSKPMTQMRAEVSPSPEQEFAQRFRALIHRDEWVLDAGCATGKFSGKRQMDANHFKIAGIDVLPSVSQNSYVDFRICGNVNQLPFADHSFDVIYARWLLEHLEHPSIAFREFHRVLKPGGRLALFTTNLLHYYGAAAKLTPHWFHLWFNRKVRGFSEDDIFPTYYRANTRWRLHELLLNAGFKRSGFEIALLEGAPNVLAFNFLMHRLGMGYQYLVTRFESLSSFRMNLIAIARKE